MVVILAIGGLANMCGIGNETPDTTTPDNTGVSGGGDGGGGATFEVANEKWGVTPAGHMTATATVTNLGSESAVPECTVKYFDSDGYFLSLDIMTADSALGAGETRSYYMVTGLRLEENIPSKVRISCEPA